MSFKKQLHQCSKLYAEVRVSKFRNLISANLQSSYGSIKTERVHVEFLTFDTLPKVSVLIGEFHQVGSNDELESVNLSAVKKLGQLRNATSTLKDLREEGNGEQNLNYENMEKSVTDLRTNMKKVRI